MPGYFQYNVFGLNISSMIQLPELEARAFEIEDIQILFGTNPLKLNKVTAEGVLYQANKDQFLLNMEGISSFLIEKGSLITIDMKEGAVITDVRLFLLGPVLGAILLQRKMLPLHGSSIEKNGSATILCGRSGAGKSTLAALLNRMDYSLLADDISLVDNNKGYSRVVPGILHFKLWQDVAQQLYKDYSKFPRIREGLLRFRVPTEKPPGTGENRLKQIIILEKKNSPGFEWEEVFGMQKFGLIKDHTYREQYMIGLETTADHFHQVNSLIKNIKVYVLSRPSAPLLLDELADFVENKLQGT